MCVGVYLKGGLSLYQYAPFTDCIYLFIYFFPEEKKKSECGCVGACVPARVLTCVFYTADFKPRQ